MQLVLLKATCLLQGLFVTEHRGLAALHEVTMLDLAWLYTNILRGQLRG